MHVKIVFWSVCSLHLEYLVFWYKFWTLNSLYFRTEGVVKIFHWILWSMQWTCLYLLYMCSWRHYFFWYFPSASLQTHFIDYVRGQAGWQVRMRFQTKFAADTNLQNWFHTVFVPQINYVILMPFFLTVIISRDATYAFHFTSTWICFRNWLIVL